MKKLFGASAKMLYRDKQALFWALAFPVIFAVVFGLFDFEQTPEVKIDLVGETAPHGLELREVVKMPVNNLSLVFVKAGPPVPA